MPEYVPSIATLRERAAQLIGRQVGRGELKSMMAAICAAKNAGTPIPPDSTGQTWITESQGIINQADQDALAILVREFAEFVENAGGGGGGDAPAVIAPFPGIGEEGVFYSQQVRTTGATPQNFQVTTGQLPPLWELDDVSGIISGSSPYPNGGLWTGEITITNDSGNAVYPFAILMTGVVPETVYTTGPYVVGTSFPLVSGDIVSTALDPYALSPSTATGSSGGSPSFSILYSINFESENPGLNIDTGTGDLSITPDVSEVGNVYNWSVDSTNYFGTTTTENRKLAIVAPIYYGEWHGALPGSFTAANIKTGLYDDTTPGPRIISGAAIWDTFSDYGVPVWPDTASPYFRVIAIPQGLLSGSIAATTVGAGAVVAPTNYATGFLTEFDPIWPNTYQSALDIDGIQYDIYVLAGGATTSGYTMVWRPGVAPAPPVLIAPQYGAIDVGFLWLAYLGEAITPFTFTETHEAEPVVWSTSGSLPDGITWDNTTHTVSGTATNASQVMDVFFFTVTITDSIGSSSFTFPIVVTATMYIGQYTGTLPTIDEAFIKTGMNSANNVAGGATTIPGTGVIAHPQALPANAVNSLSYNPANEYYYNGAMRFYFALQASGTNGIIVVPEKFFDGSGSVDPNNNGSTYKYFIAYIGCAYSGSAPIFIPPAAYINGAWRIGDAAPYTTVSMLVNGIALTYRVYVFKPGTLGNGGCYPPYDKTWEVGFAYANDWP